LKVKNYRERERNANAWKGNAFVLNRNVGRKLNELPENERNSEGNNSSSVMNKKKGTL
jgi:hypothetical protein